MGMRRARWTFGGQRWVFSCDARGCPYPDETARRLPVGWGMFTIAEGGDTEPQPARVYCDHHWPGQLLAMQGPWL